MNNADKPAFSSLHSIDGNWQREPLKEYQGLNKREYFATMAMQGLLSNPQYTQELKDNYNSKVITDANLMCAREAVDMADELLKQLEPLKQ